MTLPAWTILHVPHDSTEVPVSVRAQFVLDDSELANEINLMTDHHTLALFSYRVRATQIVRAPVSRLVVDVERFPADEDEPMSATGMGAVYSATSQSRPLRRKLTAGERECLMQSYYLPHHAALEAAVTAVLDQHGRCLIIDCHSFRAKPLLYERADARSVRPDICIGTDSFHTDEKLAAAFVNAFEDAGWLVKIDDPFSGALVPDSRYQRDPRVSAIMVEVNRGLYLAGDGPEKRGDFEVVARKINQCCRTAINTWR